jgi:glycosyltransferase involved in cell wall biosynthesis
VEGKKINRLVNQHDLLFATWDFDVNIFDLKIPLCYIQHDFIFTHFFGLHCFNEYSYDNYLIKKKLVEHAIQKNATFIASSQFVVDELRRSFPACKNSAHVVYHAFMSDKKPLSAKLCQQILNKFDIHHEYIILPTNSIHHKNMSEMLGAYYYIKKKYPDIKLIIVGIDTDGIYVQCNSPYYCDHIDKDQVYDIKSLGLVSNEELTALIQSAKVLVNVSLCEAACCSGLDAWHLKTPTAISDIPCYKEQVKRLGVKTEFFNPKNSEDIAAKVLHLLDNPELANKNVEISAEALKNNYNEKNMADNYVEVFLKAINDR